MVSCVKDRLSFAINELEDKKGDRKSQRTFLGSLQSSAQNHALHILHFNHYFIRILIRLNHAFLFAKCLKFSRIVIDLREYMPFDVYLVHLLPKIRLYETLEIFLMCVGPCIIVITEE